MILGLGTDVVNIQRIEKLLKKFGDHFYSRILSDFEMNELEEIKDVNKSQNKKTFCAKRFATKEAFAKAVGVGMGRGINFVDITVNHDIMGKPIIELSHDAAEFVKSHFKRDFADLRIDLSISDDYPFANAIVVISCERN